MRTEKLSARDIVRRYSKGMRNFSSCELESGEQTQILNKWIRRYAKNHNEKFSGDDGFEDLRLNPYLFNSAVLNGINLSGLFLPCTSAQGASFRDADLRELNFQSADLKKADINYEQFSYFRDSVG